MDATNFLNCRIGNGTYKEARIQEDISLNVDGANVSNLYQGFYIVVCNFVHIRCYKTESIRLYKEANVPFYSF